MADDRIPETSEHHAVILMVAAADSETQCRSE